MMADFDDAPLGTDSYAALVDSSRRQRNPNHAAFYYQPVRLKKKSEEAGRDIFEDRVYILILSPGQSKTEMRREAKDIDKQEYPEAWKAFQEGKGEPLVGTPVELLPGMTPSRIKELHAVHVRTIEQLAAVPDQNLRNLGHDAHTLRNKAAGFLEKNTAEVQALRAQNATLSKSVTALQRQLLDLQDQVARLSPSGQSPAPTSVPQPERVGDSTDLGKQH